jgi:hypothetical protein
MRSNSSDQSISATALGPNVLNDLQPDANQIDGVHPGDLHHGHVDSPASGAAPALPPLLSPTDDPFAATTDKLSFPYQNPAHNSSAPTLSLFATPAAPVFNHRSVTAPPGKRKEIAWAPNCAVYHTFHATEYDRRECLAQPRAMLDASCPADVLSLLFVRRLGARYLQPLDTGARARDQALPQPLQDGGDGDPPVEQSLVRAAPALIALAECHR